MLISDCGVKIRIKTVMIIIEMNVKNIPFFFKLISAIQIPLLYMVPIAG